MNKHRLSPLCDRARRLAPTDRGQQRGAVLVIGLIILLLISLISVTGANRTLLNQHMASNQHTQTNSFLAAEAGITAAKGIANDDAIRQAMNIAAAVGNPAKIESTWEAQIHNYESWTAVGATGGAEFRISGTSPDPNYTYWDPQTQTFDIKSEGRVVSGSSSLAGRTLGVQIIPAQNTISGPSSFPGALMASQGIAMGSAANIVDAYNSNYGAYGQSVTANGESFVNSNSSENSSNQLSGVSLQTCSSNGNISLSGGAPIYGDVLGIGDLTTNGSPTVYGNVHVNGNALDFAGYIYGNFTTGGDATLKSNAHIAGNVRIGGYLTTSADITNATGTVTQGNVTVNDYATFSSASTTDGTVTAGGYVAMKGSSTGKPPSIRAGGTITYPSRYSASLTDNYIGNLSASDLNIPAIQPVSPSDTGCASLTGTQASTTLANMFDAVRQKKLTPIDLSTASSAASSIGTVGTSTYYHASSNVWIANNPLTVQGHVTLLVDGNFTLEKSGTIDVGSSATLTLLVTGSTTLNGTTAEAAGSSFVRPGSNGQLQPAIAVYTTATDSATSTPSVNIGAQGDAHVAVYAPNAVVNIGANGNLYGSVVAKTINQSGGGAIHYDEALNNVSVGGTNSTAKNARVLRWWQITGT